MPSEEEDGPDGDAPPPAEPAGDAEGEAVDVEVPPPAEVDPAEGKDECEGSLSYSQTLVGGPDLPQDQGGSAPAQEEVEGAEAPDAEAAVADAEAGVPAEAPEAPEAAEAAETAAAEEAEPKLEPMGDGGLGLTMPEGGIDSAMLDEDGTAAAEGEQEEAADEEDEEDGEFDEEDDGALVAAEEEEEEDEEDRVDPMIELQEKYDQLLELHERAQQHRTALMRRVIQQRMQEKTYDAAEKQSEGKVTEHKYENVLRNVHSVRLKLRLQQVKSARMSEDLKNQLEAKRQKAIECRDSFQEFKRQVARHAEYARTGKKIPDKILQEVEEFELDKDAEVEEVRGSNISLKNRLAKLEQQLRKKDELAENLHVIDFEQLKIENQTLNEKIEERNEELHKLRKKTIVTVQIITHMREKVQFVQQEYQMLKSELAQLDQDLAAQRDLVAKTKHERDDHRAEYGKLKQQAGIFNSDNLARDFEERADHIKSLKEEINQLQKRHMQMTAFIKKSSG